MRNKIAKQLRKAAIFATKGVLPRSYVEGNKGERMVADGTAADGTPKFKIVPITGVLRLNPECTRAVYRTFKRMYAAG